MSVAGRRESSLYKPNTQLIADNPTENGLNSGNPPCKTISRHSTLGNRPSSGYSSARRGGISRLRISHVAQYHPILLYSSARRGGISRPAFFIFVDFSFVSIRPLDAEASLDLVVALMIMAFLPTYSSARRGGISRPNGFGVNPRGGRGVFVRSTRRHLSTHPGVFFTHSTGAVFVRSTRRHLSTSEKTFGASYLGCIRPLDAEASLDRQFATRCDRKRWYSSARRGGISRPGIALRTFPLCSCIRPLDAEASLDKTMFSYKHFTNQQLVFVRSTRRHLSTFSSKTLADAGGECIRPLDAEASLDMGPL